MSHVPNHEEQCRLQVEFMSRLADRLETGRREYGDDSLRRSQTELRTEIEEELLDVAGWAFVLWVRVQLMGAGKDEP